MMPVTLHRMPRGRDVAVEQIRVVGLALRPVVLVAAIVLGMVTLLIVVDVARGRAATWFDSAEWFPITIVAFLHPFAVWRSDRPFGPAFLWTLPVDRRRLALARVFAGWVWLMIALALFVGWELALAAIARVPNPRTIPPVAFAGATAMYLLGSALLLGVRHPLRWLLGTVGVVFLLRILSEVAGGDPFGVDAFLRSHSLSVAVEAAAIRLSILWLGAGLAALGAALMRHRR